MKATPCACIEAVKRSADGEWLYLCRCHNPTTNASGDCDQCERREHLLVPGDTMMVPANMATLPMRLVVDPSSDLSLARADEGRALAEAADSV